MYSRIRPLAKESKNKTKVSTDATLTVGGSNATRLAEALANLGIDSYKLASPGWKLNKENAEKIVPDLKEILETIPQDAPVIFFCLDNTVFKVATAEGELTNISKCVAEDDGFHVNGSLVVAPDFFYQKPDRTTENAGVLLRGAHCPDPLPCPPLRHLPLL